MQLQAEEQLRQALKIPDAAPSGRGFVVVERAENGSTLQTDGQQWAACLFQGQPFSCFSAIGSEEQARAWFAGFADDSLDPDNG